MRLLFAICLIFTLLSCGDSPKEEAKKITFELQDIPLSEKIKKGLESDYLENLGFDEQAIEFLNNYYKAHNYQAIWVNDSSLTVLGNRLKKIMGNPEIIGLPKNRNSHRESFNFIQDEFVITAALGKGIRDLKSGIIDFETKKQRPVHYTTTDSLDLVTSFNVDSLEQEFIQFGPSDSTYQVLAKGLIDLHKKYPIDTSSFELVSIKYDSLEAFSKAEKALLSKGYLKQGAHDSLQIVAALMTFQEENGLKPDGVIGKYTSKCLNESTARKVHRILVAMDKIRAHAPYPEKFIRINIPEYKLRFYVNDSLKSEHNLVTGSYENQTPELESKLRKIVVYPYWNVPYSISSKEILPAVQRNVGYLAKNNYKVYKNGEEIDPYSVNWKKIRQNAFPYKVIQQPGVRNSLGVIKFDFNNSHSVYFHDTPSKGLFGADVRAYSHGCMRTQNPVELGRQILFYDSIPNRKRNDITPDSLDSLLTLEENYEILLKDKIPIFIEYISVVRSPEQKMIIMHDVYGRDEEYIKIINE